MIMTNGLITLSTSKCCGIADSVSLRANDFEDAIQYFSAKKIHADYIVTNNIKDFGFSEINVMKPIDFLRINCNHAN